MHRNGAVFPTGAVGSDRCIHIVVTRAHFIRQYRATGVHLQNFLSRDLAEDVEVVNAEVVKEPTGRSDVGLRSRLRVV